MVRHSSIHGVIFVPRDFFKFTPFDLLQRYDIVEATSAPTTSLTILPTRAPTNPPTSIPTQVPTSKPSSNPTQIPTQVPTSKPSSNPTLKPTQIPTSVPTPHPTQKPTPSLTLKPTSTPTKPPHQCGNAVCELSENSISCPLDCFSKEIQTTYEFNLGSSGNMFVVKAKRNIVISSFAINSKSRGIGAVKIYTRAGLYANHEQSRDGWELVYENDSVNHNRRGEVTELGVLDKEIHVAKDRNQSFFVTSTNGLVYKGGAKEFLVYNGDENMEILEGIGTEGEFEGATYSPRVWCGRIR